MVDVWVQNSQEWLNQTYHGEPGYTDIDEDGSSGWNTMYALTRALQIELGITPASSFGPTTLAQLTSQVGNVSAGTVDAHPNVVGILQCALWCKGYWGHTDFGDWDPSITSSIIGLRGDMGLSTLELTVTPMFKSLLTMDAYVIVTGGESTLVQSIQRWMNGRYLTRKDFYVVPCDGVYSRDVQRGMMFAIQYEIGMADGTANGNFGPAPESGLQTQAFLSLGSTDSSKRFVRLFQAALTFNQYATAFDGVFGTATQAQATAFQDYVSLPTSGNAVRDVGIPPRQHGRHQPPGVMADCITTITPNRRRRSSRPAIPSWGAT